MEGKRVVLRFDSDLPHHNPESFRLKVGRKAFRGSTPETSGVLLVGEQVLPC